MPQQPLESLLKDLYSSTPQDAWAEFLAEYSAVIYQVVRYLESGADDSADCFQYVCEQLIDPRSKRLRKFKGQGPATFTTWLRAIVRNLCIDWHRKQFGRHRPLNSIMRLPQFDQEVFRLVYERAVPVEESVTVLAGEFPEATLQRINESRDRIEGVLTSNQRWLIAERASYPKRNTALDGPDGLDR